MHLPYVNYLAVLVSAIAIFVLGGLWYSPALFAKKWIALSSGQKMSAGPAPYIAAFVCSFLISWTMALVLNHFGNYSLLRGAAIGFHCWLGFAAATSFATAMFSGQPKALWLINSGYNLVSFVMAGVILSAWH
jgi:hypothetical protein